MSSMDLYTPGTSEYAAAFQAFIRSTDQSMYIKEYLEQRLSAFGSINTAIDWGAGSGRVTQTLLQYATNVIAVEPSPHLRLLLKANCPRATMVAGTIMDPIGLSRSTQVEFATMVHVLYHVADHKWPSHVLRAASYLSPGGALAVVLNHPNSGCSEMLEYFGAPRFNLFMLAERLGMERDYDLTFKQLPGKVSTTSLEDTISVAKFLLCDRDADAYSRLPQTEEEFAYYVEKKFWDPRRQAGGWACPQVCLLVQRHC